MRSRPKVKLLLSPGTAAPGTRLRTETVLLSRSETPVDDVVIRLRGAAITAVGAGQYRAVHEHPFYLRSWRSGPLLSLIHI